MALGNFWKTKINIILDQDTGADLFDPALLDKNTAILIITDGTSKTVTSYDVPLSTAQAVAGKTLRQQRNFK